MFVRFLAAIVCLGFMSGACAETLPIRKGEDLATARAALLRDGWKPVETFGAYGGDEESSYEHRLGAAGELYRAGYIEVEYCSGTGRAHCNFNYMKNGACLDLVTYGEGPRFVDSWMWRCATEIKRPPGVTRCKDAPDIAGRCYWLKGSVAADTLRLTRDDNAEQFDIANDLPRELNRAIDRAQHRVRKIAVWVRGKFEVCPIRRKDTGKEFICIESARAMSSGPPLTSVESVRKAIAAELHPGARPLEIEAFFKRHAMIFSWDEPARRYEASFDEVEGYHTIKVVVFVDKRRRFVRANVDDAYTALKSP